MSKKVVAGDLGSRLAELPLGAGHWRVTLLCGLGRMFDVMDIGLLSFVVVALAQEWGLTQGQMGLAISVGLLGMFVRAMGSGMLADRYGRKALLMVTLLVYALVTGASVVRIGGIVAPYLVGLMLGVWQFGTLVVFSMFAGVLLIKAANVWLLGEETRGRALEEIADQPLVSAR